MSRTQIEYLPVAYNFGVSTDLREFVRQKMAMPVVSKDPPQPLPSPELPPQPPQPLPDPLEPWIPYPLED